MAPRDLRAAAATFVLGIGAWTVAVPAVAVANTTDTAGTSASSISNSGSSAVRSGVAHRGPRAASAAINPADRMLAGAVRGAGGGRLGVDGRGRHAAPTMSAADDSAQRSPAAIGSASPAASSGATQHSALNSTDRSNSSTPSTLPATAVSRLATGTEQAAALVSAPARLAAVAPAGTGIDRAVSTAASAPARAIDAPVLAAAITRIVDAAQNWVSGLPGGPVTDVLQGALLLVRRTVDTIFGLAPQATAPWCVSKKDCSGWDLSWGYPFLFLENLSGVNFTDANLSGLELLGTNLTDANLTRARLASAHMYGATLIGANLTSADLTGANLDRANLNDAVLDSANLTGAQLVRANLTGAHLSQADFSRADLLNASLIDADLTGANLTSAWLDGADLTGANLTGADLTGAVLDFANLSGVTWKDTTCPDGSKTNTGCSTLPPFPDHLLLRKTPAIATVAVPSPVEVNVQRLIVFSNRP